MLFPSHVLAEWSFSDDSILFFTKQRNNVASSQVLARLICNVRTEIEGMVQYLNGYTGNPVFKYLQFRGLG